MASAEIESIMGEIVADPHVRRQQREVRKGMGGGAGESRPTQSEQQH